ncbi:MAG TPA: hypothetical protein VGM18_13510 [Candidatus Sulfotelmatobacter sp.]
MAVFSELADNELVKETLEAINRMQADDIIGRYAIGGAVGATFYLEPAATVDLDIFVTLPTASGGLLLSLAPIYDYLKSHGGKVEDEYIVIGGWPVQFLPPSSQLEQEAIAEAVRTEVEGVPTWVMSAEHLIAIALRTGRSKDHNRILQFVEQGAVNREALHSILECYGLNSKWSQFERKYLDGTK